MHGVNVMHHVLCHKTHTASMREEDHQNNPNPNPPAQVQAAQKVSDLPPSLQKIVGAFQMVPDPMARYKQLLFYASKLPPMPAADHLETHKVQGCVSQVSIYFGLLGEKPSGGDDSIKFLLPLRI